MAQRRPDLVQRNFSASSPNELWVADLSYLRCWEGLLFFAFVIDAFSRMVVGWQLATHMRTDLVLDALRMAPGLRGPGADVELVHHSDRGSQRQYTSIDYTQTLDDHGVLASVGSVGDAYDNALAESFVDSFKTELIADRVWRTRSQLELAVVEYVGWFNKSRLHESTGDIPPVEFEQRHAALTAAVSPNRDSRSVAPLSPRAAEALTTRRLVAVAAETARNGAAHGPSASIAAPTPRAAGRRAVSAATDLPPSPCARPPGSLRETAAASPSRKDPLRSPSRARKPTKTVPAEPGPAQDEGRPLGWTDLEGLVAAGWEVGSHTLDRPLLTRLDDDQLDAQLSASKRKLEERLGSCETLAYPYGLADRVSQRTHSGRGISPRAPEPTHTASASRIDGPASGSYAATAACALPPSCRRRTFACEGRNWASW